MKHFQIDAQSAVANLNDALREVKHMTILDKIKEFDEEMMAEFLYRFAKDTIDMFGKFQLPSKEGIQEFLNREIPGTD